MINRAVARRTTILFQNTILRRLSCFGSSYPRVTSSNKMQLIGNQQSILGGSSRVVSVSPTAPANSTKCLLATTNNNQFYHSKGYYSTVSYGGKDYHKLLLNMTKTKGKGKLDLNKICDMLQEIEQQKNVKLNEKTLFLMVKNCSRMKSTASAEAAEALAFKWTMEFYGRGRLDNAPNENIFALAMQAWVNTKHRDSGRRARQLLDKIEKNVQQGEPPFFLSATIYNTAMKAYAIHGDIEKAQAIFNKCTTSFEEGNENARPNVITWSTLLDACAQSGKRNSWELAEDVFRKMKLSYNLGVLKEPPDTICYSSIINACAKSNQPQQAQDWLEEMNEAFEAGNASARPNVPTFNAVLGAWAREGTPEAAARCGKILRRMKKLFEEGKLPVGPDTVSYNSVINAHSKSGQPEKAEEWLAEQFRDYKSGNTDAKQNVWSYASVINAWAILGNHKQARLVFDGMLDDYRNGNRDAKPNAASCRTVLKAIRGSALQDAGDMADSMLKEMEELKIRADLSAFVLVAQCWEQSLRLGHPNANKRIQNLQNIIDRLRSK